MLWPILQVCSYNGSAPSFACQCSFWNTGQFCEHNDGCKLCAHWDWSNRSCMHVVFHCFTNSTDNLDILLLSTVTPTTVIAVVLCIFATSLLFIFSKRRQRRKGIIIIFFADYTEWLNLIKCPPIVFDTCNTETLFN